MLYFPRWQVILIAFICLIAPFFVASNFVSKEELKNYFLPQKQINLGLDLQGGAHLAYEADLETYYQSKMTSLKADVRRALRPTGKDSDGQKRIGYRNLSVTKDSLSVTIPKADALEEASKRLMSVTQPVGGGLAGGALARDYALTQEANRFTLTMTSDNKELLASKVIEQTIEVMRRRIDAFGTREPNILRQGDDRIILQVPGESDIERLKSEVGKTAKMTFQMVNMNATEGDTVPSGYVRVFSAEEGQENISYILDEEVILSGDNLINAASMRDEYGRPTVSFTFDRKGASIFGRVTSDNVGNLFAIVLDGKVISAPRIQTAILGGSGVITGNFTELEASNLALLLRAGALPVDLEIVEERTVGPELGAESVTSGRNALLYGFLAVTAFMIAYYGIPGLFSVGALVVNTLLIFAVLSLLSATLTLPGIAGIVLGLGVAVDANVLINERIREELRRGHSVVKAVSIGYERAWITILDSHITGVVSALIMFLLGSGPIRGFAVTLALGVLLSLFTSVWVSRLLFSKYVLSRRPEKLRFGLSGV